MSRRDAGWKHRCEARTWRSERTRQGTTSVPVPARTPGCPPIAIGSHTETVPKGIRYDGAAGADADICIYEPRPETVMSRDRMFSQARDVNRLYDGMALQGEVVATISAGRVPKILTEKGSGRFIAPH